jgi:hypothetical protein
LDKTIILVGEFLELNSIMLDEMDVATESTSVEVQGVPIEGRDLYQILGEF